MHSDFYIVERKRGQFVKCVWQPYQNETPVYFVENAIPIVFHKTWNSVLFTMKFFFCESIINLTITLKIITVEIIAYHKSVPIANFYFSSYYLLIPTIPDLE